MLEWTLIISFVVGISRIRHLIQAMQDLSQIPESQCIGANFL